MEYHEQYSRYVGMIEETIEKVLPQSKTAFSEEGGTIPAHLCESMRYSLLAGGVMRHAWRRGGAGVGAGGCA